MNDYEYKGNEYMQIYPHISCYSDNERYSNGEKTKKDIMYVQIQILDE